MLFLRCCCCLLFLLLNAGCAAQPRETRARPFHFYQDTFAFVNELRWDYQVSTNGELRIHKRRPSPKYFNRCFPLIQSARKFHYHANFDEAAPAGPDRGEKAIAGILGRTSHHPSPAQNRIPVQGPDLRTYSRENEALLKQKCGTLLHSYFQRGNWRVVFPFTRGSQEREADRLIGELDSGRLPIVHLSDFPRLNHAFLLYDYMNQDEFTFFHCYDPNDNSRPGLLLFDHSARTFVLPRTPYYPGGPINAYEVYRNLIY